MKLSKRGKLNFVISLSQLNREKNYVPPAGVLRLREKLKCLRTIESIGGDFLVCDDWGSFREWS